jgi:hypothetical protein
MGVTRYTIQIIKMFDSYAVACVDVNNRLGMTHLTNTVIGSVPTGKGIAIGTRYVLGATVRRCYVASYPLNIAAVVASTILKRVANITVCNTRVNFGSNNSPWNGHRDKY